MKGRIIREFDSGIIWNHDIQSANELVEEYIKSIGGDDEIVQGVLDAIHENCPLTNWNGYAIIRLVSLHMMINS